MSLFNFWHTWRESPPDEDLYGPELATFGDLAIQIGDTCLTSCHLTNSSVEESGRNTVTGPLSGIADWVVENWLYIFWEIHTPFTKIGADGSRIPTLRDVRVGNVPGVNYSQFAEWYHRHAIGHGCSDLALPTITILPEDKVVGIAASEPSDLDSMTSFAVDWPKEPIWISKDDLATMLESFVESVIARAMATESTKRWAEWLRAKFDAARIESRDDEVRRKLMF
ncbi:MULTISPECIES: hypothetical protein [Sorangium]|uniref:hypothetical protein n=1 Tax=Sorangium TaxID=39643 RepID=UPI003D9C604E